MSALTCGWNWYESGERAHQVENDSVPRDNLITCSSLGEQNSESKWVLLNKLYTECSTIQMEFYVRCTCLSVSVCLCLWLCMYLCLCEWLYFICVCLCLVWVCVCGSVVCMFHICVCGYNVRVERMCSRTMQNAGKDRDRWGYVFVAVFVIVSVCLVCVCVIMGLWVSMWECWVCMSALCSNLLYLYMYLARSFFVEGGGCSMIWCSV